jgi:hypothetical protein
VPNRNEFNGAVIVETHTFRLADGVAEAAFLATDKEVQETYNADRKGFVRRTTARGSEGEWIVVVLWASRADADASAPVPAFDALVVGSDVRRYESLD